MSTIRFLTVKKFSDETGYTESAIYQKISLGIWIEGVHYKTAPDGRKLISVEGYHKWVEGENLTRALSRVVTQSGSRSTTKGSAGAKPSKLSPMMPTSDTQLA